MAINVQVKLENRVVLEEGFFYEQSAASFDREKYPLLSAIDPYGDTIFNREQMRRLVLECEALSSLDMSELEQTALRSLIAACEEHSRKAHRYLWFVGD